MKILVIGKKECFDEIKQKFGSVHQYIFFHDYTFNPRSLTDCDLVFDFIVEDNPEEIEIYNKNKKLIVFCNACKMSIGELAAFCPIDFKVFGFNGMPTFVNREILELSVLNKNDTKIIDGVCNKLGTKYLIVDDRVGMVSPRVVCMIINEAYYTVQEGTASKEDIDLGMKYGTNYPYGPFEWCSKIGINNVYEVLEAVFEDTKDVRYKICPLLKKEYLKFIST